MKKLVFDLETQKLADEVGGWGNIKDMLLSVACVYNLDTSEELVFTEDKVRDLIIELLGADLVIGFNIINFDYKVLQAYTHLDLRQIKTLDLSWEVKKNMGRRISLNNLAKNTLNKSKLGSGLEAVEWYRNKQMEQLISYCMEDVKITHELYKYGKEMGHVFAEHEGKRFRVPVSWR
ncbi:MAG: ribonuclease H-like domain-containing protein [Armatimonadota bacterium]